MKVNTRNFVSCFSKNLMYRGILYNKMNYTTVRFKCLLLFTMYRYWISLPQRNTATYELLSYHYQLLVTDVYKRQVIHWYHNNIISDGTSAEIYMSNADDVATVITAVTSYWPSSYWRIKAHGLELAISKTEITMLTRKRIPMVIPIRVGDLVVQTRRSACDRALEAGCWPMSRVRALANGTVRLTLWR